MVIRMELTDRDTRTLQFVGEQYCVDCGLLRWIASENGQQLSKERVRQLGNRWERRALIRRERLLYGRPAYVSLRQRGMRAVGLEWDARAPNIRLLLHTSAVALTRLHVERAWGAGGWTPERALFRDAVPGEHVPDGLCHTAHGLVAVEVDLTLKKYARTEAIMAENLARWPRMLAIAATPTIANSFRRAAANLGATSVVDIYDLATIERAWR